MTIDEARSSVMGAISMALKDPTLQQGFEIICKNLSELEETNAKLQAKIDDWQSEYIELENFKNNEISELKAQIEKMKLCQNCKFEDNDFLEKPCCDCTRCLGDIKRNGNTDKWELSK